MPTAQSPDVIAARLEDAQRHGTSTSPSPVADLANAYEIQAHRRRLSEAVDGAPAGYKVGLTSSVALAQFSASEPISGFLGGRSVRNADAPVSLAGLISPKLEVEFGFVMGRSVTTPIDEDDVIAMTDAVLLCVEIVDTRWRGGAQDVAMLVADNSYAAMAVTGPRVDRPRRLGQAEVTATLGATRLVGSGANVLGDPVRAIAWLAAHLLDRGEQLNAGDLVLSGTLTPPVDVKPGDALHADFGELGTLTMDFTTN